MYAGEAVNKIIEKTLEESALEISEMNHFTAEEQYTMLLVIQGFVERVAENVAKEYDLNEEEIVDSYLSAITKALANKLEKRMSASDVWPSGDFLN